MLSAPPRKDRSCFGNYLRIVEGPEMLPKQGDWHAALDSCLQYIKGLHVPVAAAIKKAACAAGNHQTLSFRVPV